MKDTLFLVVSTDQKFMQLAYMVGTKAECRRYQLQHGIRTTSEVIPF